MHYLLTYELVSDYVNRRAPLRAEHLRLAWAAHGRGELVLGGILTEPVDRAVLMFQGDSPDAARRFAETDPYVLKSGDEMSSVSESPSPATIRYAGRPEPWRTDRRFSICPTHRRQYSRPVLDRMSLNPRREHTAISPPAPAIRS